MIIAKLFAAAFVLNALLLLLFSHQEKVYQRSKRVLLELLADDAWWYGLALVKASDRKLGRGSVYVHLGRMEKVGLVSSRQEDVTPDYIGIPRRLYRITSIGRLAFEHQL